MVSINDRTPCPLWPTTFNQTSMNQSMNKVTNRLDLYTTTPWTMSPGLVRDKYMGDNLIQTVFVGTMQDCHNIYMDCGAKPVSGASLYWMVALRVKGREREQQQEEYKGNVWPIKDTDLVYQRIEPYCCLSRKIPPYVYTTKHFQGDYFELGNVQYYCKEINQENLAVFRNIVCFPTEHNLHLVFANIQKLAQIGVHINENML